MVSCMYRRKNPGHSDDNGDTYITTPCYTFKPEHYGSGFTIFGATGIGEFCGSTGRPFIARESACAE